MKFRYNEYKIDTLSLRNFRCFTDLEINFHKSFNVIIGINGAGKSSLLDALAIASGTFFTGIPGTTTKYISSEDRRLKSIETGSRIEFEPQFPVEITATGTFADQSCTWKREVTGQNRKTTVKDAAELRSIANKLYGQKINENPQTILPLIAYYGTGRLHTTKHNWGAQNDAKKFSRLDGYIDALSPKMNQKELIRWFSEMQQIQLEEGHTIPELESVKHAIQKCFEEGNKDVAVTKIRYSTKHQDLEITFTQKGELYSLPLHSLSDGIRTTISLIADIARRMAQLNPHLLDEVLQTPGIVMIDEIDMHLHPFWQTKIFTTLTGLFPNVQFFVTTHSPIIITNTPSECLKILDHSDGSPTVFSTESSYGKSLNSILNSVMGVDECRPDEIVKLLQETNQLIDDSKLDRAESKLEEIREILGDDDTEVTEIETALALERMFHE